jgi:cellulose synthase/poly-beta-1,6-N-acetylglucosamine synthase-like glycosyltransferase
MAGFSLLLQCVLAGVLTLLAVLSIQLFVLAYIRLTREAPRVRRPQLPDEALPHVLVQLPVRDEGDLVVRVAAAAARLDWPKDKLEIQVLDDGAAERHADVIEAVRRVTPEGVNLKVMRRGERTGFKAGNLAFGLVHSQAPYVAIFDADFVPGPDFLKKTVPALVADSGLSFVQTRWGHANRDTNWLTRAQGVLLDAHFAIEQEARFRAGIPFSFNGTGGVWRREAIDNAGGWTGDTLTEDLDLSVRCALKGWRAAMLPEIEVPGELPETAPAWRAQQARWTKGHAQVARKLLPTIWAADNISTLFKISMTLQVCQFSFYLLAGVTAAINLTLIYLGIQYIQSVANFGLFVTGLGLSASLSYLWLGQKMLGRENAPRLFPSIILAMIFPTGLVLANARATYEAFSGADMNFVRTAKAGTVQLGGWRGGPEIFVGLMLPFFVLAESAWSAPFFIFAVAGLLSIGGMGLSARMAPPRLTAQRPEVLPPAE